MRIGMRNSRFVQPCFRSIGNGRSGNPGFRDNLCDRKIRRARVSARVSNGASLRRAVFRWSSAASTVTRNITGVLRPRRSVALLCDRVAGKRSSIIGRERKRKTTVSSRNRSCPLSAVVGAGHTGGHVAVMFSRGRRDGRTRQRDGSLRTANVCNARERSAGRVSESPQTRHERQTCTNYVSFAPGYAGRVRRYSVTPDIVYHDRSAEDAERRTCRALRVGRCCT
ncbi:Hypothetical protein CINCED_3A016513 [Cinara cedri]|uniref:Uncharacterized protein n=1 Tax=Cinara cedri TaxID=506608 RepID=A0A5E4NQH5_9HEMI|nr:Hypothetical protein CINCED_3A016513 [Cinara cedri]